MKKIDVVIPFNKHVQPIDNESSCHPERSRIYAAESKDLGTDLTANIDKMRRFIDFARNNYSLFCAFCRSCLRKVITTKIDYEQAEPEIWILFPLLAQFGKQRLDSVYISEKTSPCGYAYRQLFSRY